ncbi:E3 ubiquitin-protein ligase TRIM21-like isoform X2 [Chiloscyllium plagiosum]|uniref:E3 ubiquitin-protein ligase TRIM21-like isoform X2 n=1 Tax=Chiloscyllium plagiosum TaxID=36176 RepID=UPI001CB83EA0|nr:E3 ubiquitin-protein ligase TRIM21-like isoform X2 [Chiloscyllium plagiosum]
MLTNLSEYLRLLICFASPTMRPPLPPPPPHPFFLGKAKVVFRERKKQILAMEARKHLEDLSKDVSCSICLEYFEEPVSLDCGHVFCRGCIVVFWKVGNPSCPECRLRLPGRALRPDRRMANIVGTVRSLADALGDGGQCQGLGSWCRTSPKEPQHSNLRARHTEGKVKELTKHLEAEFVELHKILHREEQEVKRRLQQRQQEVLHRTRSDSRAVAQVNPSFLQVMWNFLQVLKTVLSGPSEEVRQDDQVPVNMLKGEFRGPVQYIMWKQMRKSIKPGQERFSSSHCPCLPFPSFLPHLSETLPVLELTKSSWHFGSVLMYIG